MQEFLLTIERLPAVAVLRQSGVAYPVVSALHIIGIGLLIGGIAVLDLRILRSHQAGEWRPVLTNAVAVAAAGLALATITGVMLFSVRASLYIQNPALLLKWGLIALGLFNIAIFHAMLQRLEPQTKTGAGLKACAASSLTIWIAAIFAGRWIAFLD